MKDFPNPPSDERDHAALHTAIRAFADLRASLHQRALDLSTEYAERREAMGHGFANLNLQVQKHNDGRTITLYWGLLHFRKGKKTGFTLLKRSKGALHFDLTAVAANAPEWLRPLAKEIELRARPIREALVEVTGIERRMRVIANRLQLENIYDSTQSDENDPAFALPDGFVAGTPEADFEEETP